MVDDPVGADISQDALAKIRDLVEDYLPRHVDGVLGTMRVVCTTHHRARTMVQESIRERLGKSGKVDLPPDPRVVYMVVLEGDFRVWPPSNKTGSWLAVYVLLSFRVLGFQLAPPELAPQFDLSSLGRVSYVESRKSGR